MVPLHHPWMRPDRSITHRHTQKHIPTLIDNIAVPPSVCLVGLSHHLREATPSPIQHSTPLPPSLSPLSLSVPSYFPSFSYVWMSTDLPQDIAGSLLLNTYTSRSTSIVRPLPTPPPTPSHTHTHTHRYIERSSHVSLPHTNLTCAL